MSLIEFFKELPQIPRSKVGGVASLVVFSALCFYDLKYVHHDDYTFDIAQKLLFALAPFLVSQMNMLLEATKQLIITILFFFYCLANLLINDATYLFSFLQIFPSIILFFPEVKFKFKVIVSIATVIVPVMLMGYVNEPMFVRDGMSVKLTFVLIYLITLSVLYTFAFIYYFIGLKQASTQQKFEDIGKRISYLFHELKGSSSRILHKSSRDESLKELESDSKYILALLKLIQLSEHKKQLHLEAVSVETIVSDALHSVASFSLFYKIELVVEVEKVELSTDRDLLFLALKNIIQNAVVYCGRSSVPKQVRIVGRSHGNKYDLEIINLVEDSFRLSDLGPTIDLKKTKGLGLHIVEEISSLLKFELRKSYKDSEFKFQLRF